MHNKSSFTNIIGNLIYLSIFVLFIIGIIHTYRHHGKLAFVTSFFPPVGAYFGAESFWHKDKDKFASIDWNKRMKGDVYILYKLLSADPKKEEMAQFNETLESFSKRVMEYPKDKVDYLKEAAKKYARFLQAVNTDFTEYFENIFNKKNDTLPQWSLHSKPILDSIIRDYEIDELSASYAEMDSSVQIISNNRKEGFSNDIDPKDFFYGMKKLITADMFRINRIYKMIFNEELGINITEHSIVMLSYNSSLKLVCS